MLRMLFIFSISGKRIHPITILLSVLRRDERNVVLIRESGIKGFLCWVCTEFGRLLMHCIISTISYSHSMPSTYIFFLNSCDFLFAVYVLPIFMVINSQKLTLYIEQTLSESSFFVFTLEILVHLSAFNIRYFLQKASLQ